MNGVISLVSSNSTGSEGKRRKGNGKVEGRTDRRRAVRLNFRLVVPTWHRISAALYIFTIHNSKTRGLLSWCMEFTLYN
jgi:hypothetical protein